MFIVKSLDVKIVIKNLDTFISGDSNFRVLKILSNTLEPESFES